MPPPSCVQCGSNAKSDKQPVSAEKQARKVVRLVGEKCVIECTIEEKECECLRDTGAQISILSHEWLTHNFPDVKIRPLDELVDIRSASGTNIPVRGWVQLGFSLNNGDLESLKLVSHSRV